MPFLIAGILFAVARVLATRPPPSVISVVVRRHGVEFSWLGIGVLVCVLYAILYYVSAKSLHTALKAVPEINRDLRALDGPVQCAVFVELSVGIRERGLDGRREDVQLGKRLKEVLEANNSGWYAGQLTIPECTTMILYGSDADTLSQAIEPTLRSEPICAGARITIRQRDGQREVMLPSRLT
jgi:hypothetical protein